MSSADFCINNPLEIKKFEKVYLKDRGINHILAKNHKVKEGLLDDLRLNFIQLVSKDKKINTKINLLSHKGRKIKPGLLIVIHLNSIPPHTAKGKRIIMPKGINKSISSM